MNKGSLIVPIVLLASSMPGALATLAGPVPSAVQGGHTAVGRLVTVEVTGTWPDNSGLLFFGPPHARVVLLLSSTPMTVAWRRWAILANATLAQVTLDGNGEGHVTVPLGAAGLGPEVYAQLILLPTPLQLPGMQAFQGQWVSPVLKIHFDLGFVRWG